MTVAGAMGAGCSRRHGHREAEEVPAPQEPAEEASEEAEEDKPAQRLPKNWTDADAEPFEYSDEPSPWERWMVSPFKMVSPFRFGGPVDSS